MSDLLKRLELRSWELSRASATDEKDRYMNVVARLSREDGELMGQALDAIRNLSTAISVRNDALERYENGEMGL